MVDSPCNAKRFMAHLNLKQKQQHRLGIKCLVNVTPAVTFILVLSTNRKMLYFTTAILRCDCNLIYQLLIELEYKIVSRGTVCEFMRHPLVAKCGKTTHELSIGVLGLLSSALLFPRFPTDH